MSSNETKVIGYTDPDTGKIVKKALTFEEYRTTVKKWFMKDAVTKAYPEDAKKVWEEEQDYIRKKYEQGHPPCDIGMGLALLV